MKKKTNYQRGLRAEFIAKLFLRLKGYRILSQRYKTPVGEIDLIAQRGKTLVFIEVKARETIATALESISVIQQRRIMRAGLYFMNSSPKYGKYTVRFDAICIGSTFLPKHLENAWQMWH